MKGGSHHLTDRGKRTSNVSGLAAVGRRIGIPTLSVLILLVVWYLLATFVYPSALFSAPDAVLIKLAELVRNGVLLTNVAASLYRILVGFIVGSIVGIAMGLLMGNSPTAKAFFEPYTEFFRFIPSIALITVAVVWFGIGEMSKFFLIFYNTVFIVIINTTAGVLSVPQNKIRAAQSLGASRVHIFFRVTSPASVPYILTGMRIAMGTSFATIVAAEMLAANSGIGQMMWTARLFMQVDEVFVGLVVLGVLGYVTDRIFRILIMAFARKYSAVS